jgi:hypothetical protein
MMKFAFALAVSAAAAGSGGGSVCTPGQSVACVGPGGCAGGQVCAADGRGFGACDCAGRPDDGGADLPLADAAPPDSGPPDTVPAEGPCVSCAAFLESGGWACPGRAEDALGLLRRCAETECLVVCPDGFITGPSPPPPDCRRCIESNCSGF